MTRLDAEAVSAAALPGRLLELLRPGAAQHASACPRLMETHISWVVLLGPCAYKIRKPVNFGFLDFTSLEQREADCESEVRLNRRLCPDLYLGVVDIVERDGHLVFGGPGRKIEPAVCMRRLPEGGMLPALLQRDAVDERLVSRIARILARFHAEAPTGAGVDEFASLDAIRRNWDENFAQTSATPSDILRPCTAVRIRDYVDRFLASEADCLQQRIAQGRIRDGHGDLHAGSICLWHRKLYLFDCIEFAARFRCADVAAEVAFLAMDLDHLGRAELAHAFVDAYIRFSGDAALAHVLDFYKCYRAFVRAKVLSFRLSDPGTDSREALAVTREAQAYFDLARMYADQQRRLLVVTMGLPASGKTTVAHALACRFGLVHLSSDVVRKRMVGMRPTTRRPDPFQRGLYSQATTRRTYVQLRRQAARWLRMGQSVVLDATFGKPADRSAVRRLARRAGARLLTIVCRADEVMLRERLDARQRDPLSVSDARPELWTALRGAFVEPSEMTDLTLLDTTGPVEKTVDRATAAVEHALRHVDEEARSHERRHWC
jgi:aminoglycoside phosphotransferase family enzyme/predicted kinase